MPTAPTAASVINTFMSSERRSSAPHAARAIGHPPTTTDTKYKGSATARGAETRFVTEARYAVARQRFATRRRRVARRRGRRNVGRVSRRLAFRRLVAAGQAVTGALVLGRLARGRLRRPPLRPDAAALTLNGDTVSVVVPARDEETRLGACLAGLLADASLLEVIVVDDRSGDETAEIARRAGARVVTGAEPPAGWTGKAWALQQGIEAARGNWVLHVDADARPAPGLARALVAAAREHGDDVLSAGPVFRCATVADLVLHPAFLATIPYRFGVGDAVGFRARPSRAILNGQCVLLPRERFLTEGGYARVRDHMTEDVALARSLAGAGWSVGFVDARALLEVEMYRSARETWTGWGRSITGADVTRLRWQALDVATLWLTSALPVLRLLTQHTSRLDRALLAVRWLLGTQLARGYRPRSPWPYLAPLADPFVAVRFTVAVLRPPRTWRGRRYGARQRASR
jgi:dolichol-phosphate mannosyltransferase